MKPSWGATRVAGHIESQDAKWFAKLIRYTKEMLSLGFNENLFKPGSFVVL